MAPTPHLFGVHSMSRIGFLINPIAGMGGRVGLKGTDGVVAETIRLGAEPVANARALEALSEFKRLIDGAPRVPAVRWLTASGTMGCNALRAAGFAAVEIMHKVAAEPSAQDTRAAVHKFLAAGVDLVLFCGGDGTARDICSVTGEATPVLGIPAGVKMYSGVFGVTPARTAEILVGTSRRKSGLPASRSRPRRGKIPTRRVGGPALHVGQDAVRADLCAGRQGDHCRTDEDAVRDDIAAHLREDIEAQPATLFLLGPGSTVQTVGSALHVDKTLLGIDAIVQRTDRRQGPSRTPNPRTSRPL